MIEVKELSKSFGNLKAVDTLSFRVEQGEVFALLGPNGAGKTTTIKMILGLLRPDRGIITFDGVPIAFGEIEYKARMGYVPENCALYENLTGREFLEFVGDLHHLEPGLIQSRSEQLLELMDLSERAGELIRDYSKGMKQKILILSALLHDPDLIILDEPFSGLDANATSVFKEMIQQIAAQGKTVIFCSHVLEVVEKLVDRILIIKQGTALITGTPEEIVRRTGLHSLDRAFNALTGATDVDARAKRILDIIGNDSIDEKHNGR